MNNSPETHRAGFVSIIGKPNAGKSTLLNALLDTKLSIISPKAQTTRHRILGFDNGDDYQIVFADTPGIILPKYKLHERMMGFVHSAVKDADVIVFLVAADEKFPEDLLVPIAEKARVPRILALNKTDKLSAEALDAREQELLAKLPCDTHLRLCALKGEGVTDLRSQILANLPFSPPFYDKEALSDRPERFFITEIVREKLFLTLKDELPYSCEVEVLTFEETVNREGKPLAKIHCNIHVERPTQKEILIGEGGRTIKKIGTAARMDMEQFLDSKVFLELFVKVSPDWKSNQLYLKGFGYM